LKQRRRTQITIETRKLTIIRQRNRCSGQVWCEACGAEVKLLAPEHAAALAGIATRVLYRQIEAGCLHFQELDDGRLFICLTSLLTIYDSMEKIL
jgi:hypothetical protein